MTLLRPAARALVLTPTHDVLLVRFIFPGLTFWAPPGGGIEHGETWQDALLRELAEETGLNGVEIGPEVYVHERLYHETDDSMWDGQRDRVARIDVPARFEPTPEYDQDQMLAENVGELRWFAMAELDEIVTLPTQLGSLVAHAIRGDPPLLVRDADIPG